ncbi:Carboxyvinyl-carboxyphosphonate phosphorylmutase [Streptomyces reticuli]|nr:Carboxyvinyl-carboxyphosphonate phosphorylmutase [Streptomyces reticuli]
MTAQPAPAPAPSFAGLHHRPGEPLLLPNAWDHASAAALAARGFPAIATTSLAVAAAVGLPDGAAATREHTVRLALTLGSEPYLLSVDAEDGFSDDPDDVAELARQLWTVGAVGINLEDGLGPAERHAAKIAAVKAAVPGLFVNARTDTYWSGDGDEADTLRRLDAYQEAGADGVFVPGLTDPSGSRPWSGTPPSPSTSSTRPPGPPSPASPISVYAASASARCCTGGRSARPWTPWPTSRPGAPRPVRPPPTPRSARWSAAPRRARRRTPRGDPAPRDARPGTRRNRTPAARRATRPCGTGVDRASRRRRRS